MNVALVARWFDWVLIRPVMNILLLTLVFCFLGKKIVVHLIKKIGNYYIVL